MNTTISKSEELIREVSVELDIKEFQNSINKEINELTKTIKMKGFRDGKVPQKIIKQKFGKNIKLDIANKMINNSIPEIIKKENINLATAPDLIDLDTENDKALKFTLKFEIFPDINLSPINELNIEIIKSELTEDDINKAVKDVCKQNAVYTEVDRESANSDKVNIDFVATIDGEKFQGSDATKFDVILGDNSMIAGFEQGLLAKKSLDKTTLQLQFPKDYQNKDLASKKASFDITINSVMAVEIPELSNEIVEKYGASNVAEFQEKTKKYMQNELQKRLKDKNKSTIFSTLLKANDVVVPESSINNEAKTMANNMQQQQEQQQGQQNNSPKFDINASMFHKQAKERVQLGLLIKEITKENNISVDDKQVKDKIKQMAQEHNEDENTVINWYYEDKTRLTSIESLLLEELVIEHIVNHAKISKISKTLTELN